MKKMNVLGCIALVLLAIPANGHAQSLKDLFNKDNIEKVVNAVTDKNTASMTGTLPSNSNRTTCSRRQEARWLPRP